MVYFSAILRDGIFEIDLSNSYTNESSIYAVSNKRAKLDLDSALLWHCRLGHISKKHIEKLQHDGLRNSTNLRAFEKYVSCMSGKMAKKPYTHQVERANDLLRLIHTDVCGPFKIMSRQGASYFVTFTDGFSRYGYVYLLNHKHKVFETFKMFQKEVENKLGKTIKLLRSDRGGEYISQEFLDHLKDHGIIAHRTPPYTSQHNGVSKRRNRTLLDMVRSMMSQTTLPKSFWDYALETSARIINMVLTKKVEKTPYKVWHGQAPKLSYLKVLGSWKYPMQEKLRLSKSQGASTPAELKRMQNVPYASAVGFIMYVVRCTRLDVVFAPNVTSRFQQNPDADDLKSQTVYVFVLNGGVVDWKSAKQSIFATSSAEAEYIADFDASKEAVWVRKFISRLDVVPKIEEPISMYYDDTGAIALAYESRITKGARRFCAKVHYLHEVIEYGDTKDPAFYQDPTFKILRFATRSCVLLQDPVFCYKRSCGLSKPAVCLSLRSTRTCFPTDRMCIYIDAEEHELGDLGELANYKAALLDPESDKWLNAMNV
nr:retrotransposon protein, putative, Ty1-copia subclass [Tanacetum cinerariifolium]